MPPSEMIGMSWRSAARAQSSIAVICGHADAGDDAGGADAARADADLDGVDAGLDERSGALGGGDVAGDELEAGGGLAGGAHRVEHAAASGRARCRRR